MAKNGIPDAGHAARSGLDADRVPSDTAGKRTIDPHGDRVRNAGARQTGGSGLRRVAGWLGAVPAFGYGLAFLALIPLYAVIYYVAAAADFYHATVQHEQFYLEQQETVIRELIATVRADLRAAYGGNMVPVSADSVVCIDRMDVFDLAIAAGGQPTFKLVAPVHPASAVTGDACAAAGADDVIVLNAMTDLGEGFDLAVAVADVPAAADTGWLTVRYLDAASHRAAKRLFPAPLTDATFRIGDDPVSHQFAMPARLSADVQALVRASQGFPAAIPGEFWRMVYLSAVTATTTGYGDIVPITTRARLLTASESIAGLILVGLFLNSLAQRLPTGKHHAPEPDAAGSSPPT